MISQGEREHNPFLVLYDMKQVQAAEVSQKRTAVSSKCFQLNYTCSDRLRHRAPPLLFPYFFPFCCDVSWGLSYFASTILNDIISQQSRIFCGRRSCVTHTSCFHHDTMSNVCCSSCFSRDCPLYRTKIWPWMLSLSEFLAFLWWCSRCSVNEEHLRCPSMSVAFVIRG
jgi:hypothetical protein